MPGEVYAVREVFVPGGLPTVTYNAREDLRLEDQVKEHLDSPYSILSISGPTKTGKTTLIRHIVKAGIFVSGGSISSFEDFLGMVADELVVPASSESGVSTEESAMDGGSATAKIPTVLDLQYKAESSGKETITQKQTQTRSLRVAVRQALLACSRPLVVDDFHYIDPEVQLQLVRYLKDLVFEGHPVVFVAVPHRAYDAVRVEKEMTGRVKILEVGFWNDSDLEQIVRLGFDALNLSVGEDVSRRLVRESFRSPHLMQEFCQGLCRDTGVMQTSEQTTNIFEPPAGWDAFFKKRATSSSKSAFDRLARGPRQRTDRIPRTLKDGRTVDIYGATLVAIGHTGPLTSITYEQLRGAFRDILQSELPQRHEIIRILDEMTKIAREQIAGEPVVDYDEEFSTLFISDPYFAYYLRWGSQEIAELKASAGE